jgi:hypothetical protein
MECPRDISDIVVALSLTSCRIGRVGPTPAKPNDP